MSEQELQQQQLTSSSSSSSSASPSHNNTHHSHPHHNNHHQQHRQQPPSPLAGPALTQNDFNDDEALSTITPLSNPRPSKEPYYKKLGTPLNTRPASPYTLNPPIDSDGLSWPSLGARNRIEKKVY
ncbi:unnamed protein product [[Candida] boidinii]|uniref:Unnamed protein product n=1 Tax=Candida boidinii TaxID=5477 RepID=A0ACB5U908_CANBO|nr:unnamed protein product [[Candida] boidinii]